MEKFVSPCELPTAAQTEVGIILMEECAEVQSAMSKCLRFGFEEKGPGFEHTNIERLAIELGNLMAMIEIFDADVATLDTTLTKLGYDKKMAKHNVYLQRGNG